MTLTTIVKRFVAPVLPIPADEYEVIYFDKYNSILRLYFNQVDTLLQQIVANPSYKVTAFTAATSITVTHNFGIYPVVDVINNSGVVTTPVSVTHTSINAFTVILAVATTGNVIAVAGRP